MTYNITHRTLYEYAAPVTVSQHVARLEPGSSSLQECERFNLKIFPEPALRKEHSDYFGNRLCFFAIQEVHTQLEVIRIRENRPDGPPIGSFGTVKNDLSIATH
ncbi:MAG: transglutaminase N-terminal domain-containing protein, partial [Verrucomicrobiota bacterium]